MIGGSRALLALALIFAARPANAERLAFVTVPTGSDVELSPGAVESDLRHVLGYRDGLELHTGALALAACKGARECLSRALDAAGVGLLLIVSAPSGGERPLLAFQLLEARTRKISTFQTEADDPGAEAISSAVRRGASALLDETGHPELGRAVVIVSPVSAKVDLDGAPPIAGGEYPVFKRPAGEYVVRARLEGHREASAPVRLEVGREVQVSLHLEPERSFWSSPWLWTVLGVAVAGAVGTGIAVSASAGGDACLCVAPPGDSCPPCR